MILEMEYLCEVKDYLLLVPETKLRNSIYTRCELLANKDNMLDLLWAKYQKSVEEYRCDPAWSFCDALNECLGTRLEEADLT